MKCSICLIEKDDADFVKRNNTSCCLDCSEKRKQKIIANTKHEIMIVVFVVLVRIFQQEKHYIHVEEVILKKDLLMI